MEKHNISSLSRVQGYVGTWQETMSFQWVGSNRISTQERSLRDYSAWNGSLFLKLNWGLLTEKTRFSSFLQHPQQCWGDLYGGLSELLELQLTSQPCDTHQGFVRSQNSWCRESQELQESHYYQCPGGQATERWYHRGTVGALKNPKQY